MRDIIKDNFLKNIVTVKRSNNLGLYAMSLFYRPTKDEVEVKKPFRYDEILNAQERLFNLVKYGSENGH